MLERHQGGISYHPCYTRRLRTTGQVPSSYCEAIYLKFRIANYPLESNT